MSINRDSLFPASSVGRVQGAAIQRSASPSPSLREPLATHPLLSPSPSTAPTSPVNSPSDLNNSTYTTPARYVTYTPKHRVASSATTGTTTHAQLSLSPQHHHGDATTKLQMMNLKAATQKLGLENGSLGWAILDKLVSETDQGSDWNEIWTALTTEQATLLLPLEQCSDNITAELIKSHIIFCNEPLSSSNGSHLPIVTLSGLRGMLSDETLTIRSSLHPSSKAFRKILSPSARSSAFASLPPLPSTNFIYPSFTVASSSPAISQLPLPPRPLAPAKPPLPPRPGARQFPATTQPATPTSRITNPFASLFGSKPAVLPVPTTVPAVPASATATNPEAIESVDYPIDIQAHTIDKRINFEHLAKSICKGLRDEIKTSLLLSKQSGMSGWIADMVGEWLEGTFFPFNRIKQGGSEGYVVNEFSFEAEEISRTVQSFYSEVTDTVVEKNRKHSKQRKFKKSVNGGSVGSEDQASLISNTDEEMNSSGEKDKFPASIEQESDKEDEKIRQVMERVEATICDLFYDRLFIPSHSDDLSHDEALSSRIAALNMLDLSLEHLGVEVEIKAQDDVHDVVKACGETLTMLDLPGCHRPSDKSALLVKAHKDLVDGLSKLPPIRLRPDNDPDLSLHDANKTPRISEKEMESISSSKRLGTEETSVNVPSTNPPEPGYFSPSSNGTPSSSKQTPVSGDVILPLMIYSVVQSNPPRFLSHLLFIQRFRNQAVGGEENYCLINLMAVAEFLENVDLTHLGLGKEGEQVVSTANLSPIPVLRSRSLSIGSGGGSPATIGVDAAMRLRGRVEQQVGAVAGSANKVLSGVVDSSFGVLRALLPGNTEQSAVGPLTDVLSQESKPSFALLRKDSGFSIASLAASLPGARPRASGAQHLIVAGDEGGQQMTEVSAPPRPNSSSGPDGRNSSSEDSSESDDEEEHVDEGEEGHDARSIRSFESMMNKRKKRRRNSARGGRKSIADRLANVSGLGKLSSPHETRDSPPTSRRSSLLPVANRSESPSSSRAPSPIAIRIAPPNQRFLECNEDDLRISEVKELLREYKRLVDCVRAMGGFQE